MRVFLPLFALWYCVNGLADIIRIGNTGEPATLDPHRYNLRLEETILNDLYLGLTTMDAAGNIVPGAALSWEVSSDGLTWTFDLRPNARWSDGEPVTASDFVYSYRRLVNPETASSLAFFMYPIKNAEAINSGTAALNSLGVSAPTTHRLRIQLEKPFPFFAERLLYPTAYPVPPHAIATHGDDWVKPGNMVTNGAFVLADWRPQGFVELVKNQYFHDASNVTLSKVRYIPIQNATTALNRYRAGELDVILDFPPGELRWLRQHMADHVRVSPLLSVMYLVFNLTEPPFDDPRVRKALALAIDRRILTEKVLKSGELVSYGLVPSMVANYPHATTQLPDIALARDLLTAAGFTQNNPLKLTLRYISGDENKRVQIAIASMWRSVGVQTSLHHTELSVHFADLRQANFQVAQAGWFGENNPEHYLELLMSDIGDVNYGRYVSPKYDRLIRQAKRTADLETRITLLKGAEIEGLRDFAVIPLYSVMIRSLVDPRILGWRTNPRNVHGVRYLHRK